jgi:sulfoxide reductase catalytic subunit YedY
MYVRRRRGWEIPDQLATPESVYLSRREIVKAAGLAVLAGSILPGSASAQSDLTVGLYPAPRNSKYTTGRGITPESINTSYNKFYEFGTQMDVAGEAAALKTRPWDIRIDGMVEKKLFFSIDDLIRRMPLEERLYRHRAVEGWSMAVPWTGFPLSTLIQLARPSAGARYLRMESFLDSRMASGQNSFYPWPYVEGLTMAEATNELAFLVTGAYGKPVAKVMGAPLRVHLPWKYGFKSIKSIVRLTFTDEQPVGFWQQIRPAEYGFWANVNPAVPHPRWSQSMERNITSGELVPTQIFNGYGEYVAGLYNGLDDEPLYM